MMFLRLGLIALALAFIMAQVVVVAFVVPPLVGWLLAIPLCLEIIALGYWIAERLHTTPSDPV